MSVVDLSTVVLALFTLLLIVAAVTTSGRALELRRKGQSLPSLLIRDVIVLVGLAWPFAGIAFVRAFMLGPQLVGQVWWVVVTSVPPLIGMLTYCYFELFVIGKTKR